MGIDIYLKKEKQNSLFLITDALYDALDKNIIDDFEKITGVFIDNYGKAKLSFQHSQDLFKLITTDVENKKINFSNELKLFIEFLEKIVKEQIDLELIGD